MAQAQRVNQETLALNEAGSKDEQRFSSLQRSFNHFQQQYETSLTQRTEAWDAYNSLQKPFMEAIFSELKKIGPAQTKLMAAMREEIGLTSDPEFMLARLEDTQQRIRDAGDKFLSQFTPD